MAEERVRPFYCGTQKADWACRNCFKCAKGYDDDKGDWQCDLERRIDEAFMGDGTVSSDDANRMGVCDKYTWDCPERADA